MQLQEFSGKRDFLEEKQSNAFYFSSFFFETYKTMWFFVYFLNQAGGEFPSGLCVSSTLCSLVWLVVKIVGKLHGKSVLADSSDGLGSPGGSRDGFQSDESHQRLWRL